MSATTAVRTPRVAFDADAEVAKHGPSKLDAFLLSCGIIAPLTYVAIDIFLASRWAGYSYRDQTISELNAIGAPTRTLSIVLGIIGYAVLVAFGVGVWRSAANRRTLRVAGGALTAIGILAWFGVPLLPMHVRGAEQSLTDTLHVAQLAVAGPLLLVVIGCGAAAFGRGFRLYSAATVLVMLGFGGWAGTYSDRMVDGLVTPWMGVIERISVYSYQVWFAVFALALITRAFAVRGPPIATGTGSYRVSGREVARANGLPSESRQIAHRSPGWMTEPPRSRMRRSAAGRSSTVK